nr:MAG TPA: hypothetical protein [Microviridae sp.]
MHLKNGTLCIDAKIHYIYPVGHLNYSLNHFLWKKHHFTVPRLFGRL